MSVRVRIVAVDDNFWETALAFGLCFPSAAPAPGDGCIVEIEDGSIGFFGRAFDSEGGFLVGGCSRQHWTVRRIRDYGEEDLYLRSVESCASKEGGLGTLREIKALIASIGSREVARSENFPPLDFSTIGYSEDLAWIVEDDNVLFDVVYEHDVHDHSLREALATVGVTCSLDLSTGKVTAESTISYDPPRLSRAALRSIQPGDYVPVGKELRQLLSDHITTQGSQEPMVFPCLRLVSMD